MGSTVAPPVARAEPPRPLRHRPPPAPAPARRPGRLLRGPRPGVRRLVPAPRPLRARRHPRRGLERGAGRAPVGGSTACPSRPDRRARAGHRAGGRHCSPSKGELSMYDAAAAPLDRARERLLAHRLRAHLHVRDAWAEPDGPADAPVHRVLAEPRRAGPARGLPGTRPSLAAARRPVRVHRLARRSDVRRRGPPGAGRRPVRPPTRRRPRVHDRQGLPRPGRVSPRRSSPPASPTSRSRRPAASSCWGPPSRADAPLPGASRSREPSVTNTPLPRELSGATTTRRYTPRDVPPLERDDRDRRLRRHGRGDDRRAAPRPAGRARAGRRQPSTTRAPRGAGARVRHPDGERQRRRGPRRGRHPARDQAPDARPGRARDRTAPAAAASSC